MKIIHVVAAPASGGAEILVKDLCKSLLHLGHQVKIVFISDSIDIGRGADFQNRFLSELSSLGISYSILGHNTKRNPILGMMRMRKIIKKFEPDIIHCHLLYGLLFNVFFRKEKIIYTHHSINLNTNGFFLKFLFSNTKAIVGISDLCTNTLSKRFKNPIFTIYNGVDKKRLNISRTINKESKKIIGLAVGRLTEQKNYHLLIDSVAKIKEVSFKIIIAGEGHLEAELAQKVKRLDLQDHIEFLGNVVDMNSVYNKSDFFIMTSSWEGLPISAIEATLHGLPLILSDVGGNSEIINNCGNGILVKSLDSSSFARELKSVLKNEKLRAKYSKSATDNGDVYSMERCVIKHEELYRNVQ